MKGKAITLLLDWVKARHRTRLIVVLIFLAVFHHANWLWLLLIFGVGMMAMGYFRFEYDRRFLTKEERRKKNREIIGLPDDENE